MTRANIALPLAVLIVALSAATTAAQQPSVPHSAPSVTIPAKPNVAASASNSASARVEQTWDQTKAMARNEWHAAKHKWAMEKVKWHACNRQAHAERLSASKSWDFIASCMAGT